MTARLIGNIRGPKGDPGDKGEKGDRGDAGIAGESGTPGADGAPGAEGAKGDPGDPGDPGAPGEKGDKGDAGADGAKGDPGAKGDKGDPGAKGDQGIQGVKGNPGADGAKGDQGIQGIQGIQGVKGDKGDPGAQGIKGDAGPAGPGGVAWAGDWVAGTYLKGALVTHGFYLWGAKVDTASEPVVSGKVRGTFLQDFSSQTVPATDSVSSWTYVNNTTPTLPNIVAGSAISSTAVDPGGAVPAWALRRVGYLSDVSLQLTFDAASSFTFMVGDNMTSGGFVTIYLDGTTVATHTSNTATGLGWKTYTVPVATGGVHTLRIARPANDTGGSAKLFGVALISAPKAGAPVDADLGDWVRLATLPVPR